MIPVSLSIVGPKDAPISLDGAKWTALRGTDDGTASLVLADQRGAPYPAGADALPMPPIGAAAYQSKGGLLFIVQ